jgi:polar amino acid transport system substrate-binding protein
MVSQLGYTWFVKKGEAGKYTKIDDFKGKTVGVHGGSATGKDLTEQNAKVGGAMKIVEESTAETAPKKLAGGRYGDGAAIYCARPVCAYQAKKENLAIEPVSFDGKLQSHSILASKKSVSPAEFEAYKKALSEVLKTDEMKKIFAENSLVVHPDNK